MVHPLKGSFVVPVTNLRHYQFPLPAGTHHVQIKVQSGAGEGYIRVPPRRLMYECCGNWDGNTTVDFSVRTWKEGLRLDVTGDLAVSDIVVTEASDATTIYLIGDSTVCDERKIPYCTWGQMLPCFFRRGIAVANYARAGNGSASWDARRRAGWLFRQLKPKDYLFIQFGHNDQKVWDLREPMGRQAYLDSLKWYLDQATQRGGQAVLVTPVQRNRFLPNGEFENTLEHSAEAIASLAATANVPLLDLCRRSETYLRSLGPERAKCITLHAPPGRWARYPNGVASKTHHTEFGAYEMAKCVAEEIRLRIPGLVEHLRPIPPPNHDPVMIRQWESRLH